MAKIPAAESDYFRHREAQERAAAKGAVSAAARRAHQELAQYYASILAPLSLV